jgi:type IV pilus assembly protein PilX
MTVFSASRHATPLPGARTQRGIVLFIALLVTVVLAVATIALFRSTDTATAVSGNLTFAQAAIGAVDRSIEQSIHALFDAALIPDKTASYSPQNYFACVQDGLPPAPAAGGRCMATNGSVPEIPQVLREPFSTTTFNAAGLSSALLPVDSAGNRSYYVIERMCLNPGPAVGSNCNLSSSAFGADPGTQHYQGLIRPGDAYYRVTIRVEGPRNTVSYAQAMLK